MMAMKVEGRGVERGDDGMERVAPTVILNHKQMFVVNSLQCTCRCLFESHHLCFVATFRTVNFTQHFNVV